MPDNHLFHYAKRQMEFIEGKLQVDGTLKSDDYDNVFIGLMCVRELKGIDDEFCNAVFAMTTSIIPKDYKPY